MTQTGRLTKDQLAQLEDSDYRDYMRDQLVKARAIQGAPKAGSFGFILHVFLGLAVLAVLAHSNGWLTMIR